MNKETDNEKNVSAVLLLVEFLISRSKDINKTRFISLNFLSFNEELEEYHKIILTVTK